MGMHRDATNLEFDPIERNTRRQVWWSIYSFERILCSILGRPTVIDDRELSMQMPDDPMPEQQSMSAEFMTCAAELVRMSYSIRQRAYFDANTNEERMPSLAIAESLMRECNSFFQTIPKDLSLDFLPSTPPEQKGRLLLLYIYYFYTRCIVSRDFLIKKVESNIAYLEEKDVPASEELSRTLALSEDCVESAHQSLRCIIAGADMGIIGFSWLDLFFVFHSVLIVCADFLARPKDHQDTTKDVERKEVVRAMLNHVRGMKLALTYKTLGRIAMQFASITGVFVEQISPENITSGQGGGDQIDEQEAALGRGETAEVLAEISDVREDWFANATSSLGLDFFELHENQGALPLQPGHPSYPEMYGAQTSNSEVDDWTAQTLRGMHTL
jgi:proline utilization trans-activator